MQTYGNRRNLKRKTKKQALQSLLFNINTLFYLLFLPSYQTSVERYFIRLSFFASYEIVAR